MDLEKQLRNENEDNPIIAILRDLKMDSYSSNLPILSSIDHLIVKMKNDPDMLEAFYLGHLVTKDHAIGDDKFQNIYIGTEFSIKSREWHTFNRNILTLIDATSIPIQLKQHTQNLEELMKIVDLHFPEKFFPKIHLQKRVIKDLNEMGLILTLNDVIRFNHQFKMIFNYLIETIKTSKLFDAIVNLDLIYVDDLIAKVAMFKNPNTKADKIYDKKFSNQNFISIDIKQANSTITFVYYALKLFKDKGLSIEDMEMGLEKFHSDWNTYSEKFNWSDFVRSALGVPNRFEPVGRINTSLCIPSKLVDRFDRFDRFEIVTNSDVLQILIEAFIGSKLTREVILGVIQRTYLRDNKHTFGKLLEVTCRLVMNEILTCMQENIPGLELISFSMDEIVFRAGGDKLDLVKKIINTRSSTDILGSWFKNYLRIEEFNLKAIDLPNKKTFFAKVQTMDNGEIKYEIKMLESESRIQGLGLLEEMLK